MTSEYRIQQAANIRSLLYQLGLTAVAVEQHYGLYRGCVYDTIREPNEAGEAAIAAALDVAPSNLWPDRFDASTGQRLSPQPRRNYLRTLTNKQRQKRAEQQA